MKQQIVFLLGFTRADAMQDWIIVEMQCFKSNTGNFIVKEMAFKTMEEDLVYLFRPPFSKRLLSKRTRRVNNYCTTNFHGLKWETGDIDYGYLKDILRSRCHNFCNILTQGSEKKSFLEKILCRPVIDVQLPALNSLPSPPDLGKCPSEHEDFFCARENASKISYWLSKNCF